MFKNLGDLIRRDRDPQHLAIIDLGGEAERSFTFAALDAMACGVARALVARRFARGDRIAILAANRAEYLAACYGIMRAGLVAVPVNWRFAADTVAFIIGDAGARMVFCDPARRAQCPPGLPVVCFGDGFERFLDPGPFDALPAQPGEPALFLYTSGSTGVPKGVVLSHHSHIWVGQTRLGGQDLSHHRYLIAAPLYHMNALALAMLACMAHATIVLLPQFTAAEYIAAIERHRCTFLTAVPPMIAMMLRETGLIARTDLSSVAFVRMGSAPVSEGLMTALRRALPAARVTNAYGTTEAGPVVFGPHPDGLPQPVMSVGYPHREVALRLVDGSGRLSDQGELQIRSPAMMNGYHNRPDLPSPITADGFYRTGDVFRRDADGFHYFIGRTDDMFVCGGENIYPGDVERMLERHKAVAQACVVPVDDEVKGQKPVAFIVARAGETTDAQDIRQFALANGPAYQHPRFVWFMDRLPLSSTNKIDRAALKREAAERVAQERVAQERVARAARSRAPWPGLVRPPAPPSRSPDDGKEADAGDACRRLPVNHEIFLDHVAHFVSDLEGASRALVRAGFAPTPASVQAHPGPAGAPQPTGTGNVTCMLEQGYLEVLFKTSDTPLSRELDAALARYRGVHLAAFAVSDAAAMHARLREAGFQMRPLVNMQRPVTTAGGDAIAAFSVVRLAPGEMPEGRIQALTHHTEDAV
ncbi:MAG: AMP-binding protein, partial [Bradyrhizobiaceae bacterium]|nr:AMP-binding protein [Bradyrhizobiaceae bacterium]